MLIKEDHITCFLISTTQQKKHLDNPHCVKAKLLPCQRSKMERFAKTVSGFKPLTIFAKLFILDV